MLSVHAAIIQHKQRNPGASTRDIAAKTGVSNVTVWKVLNAAGYTAESAPLPRERAAPRTEEKPRPEIRPHMMPGLTLDMLMGRRAPRAKLQPA